jgi:hypothetical protein
MRGRKDLPLNTVGLVSSQVNYIVEKYKISLSESMISAFKNATIKFSEIKNAQSMLLVLLYINTRNNKLVGFQNKNLLLSTRLPSSSPFHFWKFVLVLDNK